jgi:hypothetical protein
MYGENNKVYIIIYFFKCLYTGTYLDEKQNRILQKSESLDSYEKSYF